MPDSQRVALRFARGEAYRNARPSHPEYAAKVTVSSGLRRNARYQGSKQTNNKGVSSIHLKAPDHFMVK